MPATQPDRFERDVRANETGVILDGGDNREELLSYRLHQDAGEGEGGG